MVLPLVHSGRQAVAPEARKSAAPGGRKTQAPRGERRRKSWRATNIVVGSLLVAGLLVAGALVRTRGPSRPASTGSASSRSVGTGVVVWRGTIGAPDRRCARDDPGRQPAK